MEIKLADKHIHDCTGPDATCPCGYRFVVPPVWVSIEVGRLGTTLVDEAFNSDDLSAAITALRRAADLLERDHHGMGR